MAMLVLDSYVEDRLKAEREALGIDGHDEVWDGVYNMAPIANNEHQELLGGLVMALKNALGASHPARVFPGANVSDRDEDWLHNYRVPDVAVVYPNGAARDCDTHLCGGPDFAVEIVSPRDRSREKFDFYSSIGVRELMLIDRDPWKVELYSLKDGRLELSGKSDLSLSTTLRSSVVPVSFCLIAGTPRPQIEIVHHDGKQRWLV